MTVRTGVLLTGDSMYPGQAVRMEMEGVFRGDSYAVSRLSDRHDVSARGACAGVVAGSLAGVGRSAVGGEAYYDSYKSARFFDCAAKRAAADVRLARFQG